MHVVYLSLGSNLGDRHATMRRAIDMLNAEAGTVDRQSSPLETEPWGFESANKFLNMCVRLLTIDIDMLMYDDVNISTPALTLPHPHMHERDFVMIPLREIL